MTEPGITCAVCALCGQRYPIGTFHLCPHAGSNLHTSRPLTQDPVRGKQHAIAARVTPQWKISMSRS